MKKKIVAIVLSCLLFLTGIPGALALGNTEQQGTDVFFYEGAKALATGDLTLAEEADPEVPVIRSVADYYKAAGKSSRLRSASSAIASKVDNSQSRFFPEIGNQGQMGSCTSWAQTYYQFTYTMNRSMNRTTTPENCFSPQWAYNLVNGGKDEGSGANKIYDILQRQGAATMQQVPYTGGYFSWSPESRIWSDTSDYRLKDYQYLSVGSDAEDTPITGPKDEDLDVLKTALSNGEILTYSTCIRGWTYGTISSRPEVPENAAYAGEGIVIGMENEEGPHRMTIVGYNDDLWVDINGDNIVQEQEMGAFKVANSWGNSIFMNDGFMWVSYDALNRVSSVPGAENFVRSKEPIFRFIARIDVEPYNSDSNIVFEYTLNSKNRATTPVTVIAEKDGIITELPVTPYGIDNVSSDELSYNGAPYASDGTMCLDLGAVIPGLDSDSFRDYHWRVKFKDDKDDDAVLTVKDAKIVDKNTGEVYTSEESMPFKLNGQEKTVALYKSNRKTAVVYYRGYLDPYICYKTGDGQWTQEPGVRMERTDEKYGYTHKYMIKLEGPETAEVRFTDGNGNWDDNGGENYILGEGTHTIISKNVKIEPLEITSLESSAENNEACTNQRVVFSALMQGGYAPYQYRYEVENLATGEITESSEYKKLTDFYLFFKSQADYRVTVYGKDIAETVTSKSIEILVKDKPCVFSSFTASEQSPVNIGSKIVFSGQTLYEQIRMPFPNNFYLSIYKNGRIIDGPAVTVKSIDDVKMSSNVCAEWTPTEAGNYTAQITVTDKAGVTTTARLAFEVRDLENNYATIYYKGYDCPYIHFQADGGKWTTSPGVEMTPSYEVEGYTHKYTIDLGGASYANVSFNDGNGNWDNNEKKNYRFTAGAYGFEGGAITPLDLTKFKATQLSVDCWDGKLPAVGESIGMFASAEGGYGLYEYQFGLQEADGTVKWTTQYSEESYYYFTTYSSGSYKAFVNIKDATGATDTKTVGVDIKGLEITSFDAAPQKAVAGTEMTFTASTLYELYSRVPNQHTVTIVKDGAEIASIDMDRISTDGYSVKWTPQETGKYKACLHVADAYGQTAEKSIGFTVLEQASNELTVYYKGYACPNIHYQIGAGAWTDVPGVKMTPTNEVNGYTHKYTIDLGDAEYANVCFNDGSGSWDNNNGQNYRFEAGTYGCSGGVTVPLDLSKPRVTQLTVSAQDGELTVGKSISLAAAAEGGEAPYEYQFGLQGTDGTVKWTTQYSGENSHSFTAYTGGSFKAFVNIKDANGAVCTKAISLEIKGLEITSFAVAPKTGTVGTEMVLTARTLNELFGYGANVHGIAIKKGDKPVASIGGMNYTQDGRYTDFTAKWTPQEAGDYTARLYIKDAYGQTAEKTIAFTVMEKASNTLTIYYKGYTNPNIHYQVGDGAWTAVPGIAMTPTGTIVGYTHIYTIDLGAATYANVCFNDGNGNWDSNNGQNYRFEAGIYTYKDGTLVKHS